MTFTPPISLVYTNIAFPLACQMKALEEFLVLYKIPIENTLRGDFPRSIKSKVASWKGERYLLYVECVRNTHLKFLQQHSTVTQLSEIKGRKVWALLGPLGISFAALHVHGRALVFHLNF